MRRLLIVTAVVLGVSGCANPGASSNTQVVQVDSSSYDRGRLLYENHCPICHDSRAHIRTDHKAQSPAQVQQWVVRWSSYLKLDWDVNEVQDVTTFLSNRYYKFGTKTD